MMTVYPSDYAWRTEPMSARQKENQCLGGLIKQFWLESGGVNGYRKITDDLHEIGEPCSKHRVYRLMHREQAAAAEGQRRHVAQDDFHDRPVEAPAERQQSEEQEAKTGQAGAFFCHVGARQPPRSLYNLSFWKSSIAMEAERLNSLSNRLSDLSAREQDLRRYL